MKIKQILEPNKTKSIFLKKTNDTTITSSIYSNLHTVMSIWKQKELIIMTAITRK